MLKVSCKQCSIIFNKSSAEINKTKNNFCSRSCAATYNNSHNKNRKFGPKKAVFWKCKICDCDIEDGRLYCKKHSTAFKPLDINLTIEEVKYKNGLKSNRFIKIKSHSRRVADTNGMLEQCFICGYKNAVQACHIIPVSKFPESTKIKEVNSPNNLIGLCPNHHWELDHDMLCEEDRNKIEQYKLQK